MLLKTIFSEVCGTDVHLWHGRLSGVPYPIIPGHVSVGTIAKMRGPITLADGHPAREGDWLVFFDVHRTCGTLLRLRVSGTPTKCAERKVYGITDAAADGLFGGWSEAIYLEPGVVAARLPDRVSAEDYIGARLRLDHRRARHRSGRAAARRPRPGAGHAAPWASASSRWPGCPARPPSSRPGRRPTAWSWRGSMGADLTLDVSKTSVEERRAARRRAHRRAAVPTSSSRRRDRPGRRGGPGPGPGRRALRDRRPLHERGPQHHQRARAHQPKAPRHPRVLGQRGRALHAGAGHPGPARAPPAVARRSGRGSIR